MRVWENIAKADAGEGDAAEINEVDVPGGHARIVDASERGRFQAGDGHHEEDADLYQKEIAAGAGNDNIHIDIAGSDEKSYHFPKDKGKEKDVR